MNRKTWLAAAAAVFFCAGAQANPPIESYGRLPTIDDVTLAPDGKTIALVQSVNADRYIVVEDIGAEKPRAVLNIHDQKLRWLQWADNTRLLITESMTTLPLGLVGRPGEFATTQYLDITKNELRPL